MENVSNWVLMAEYIILIGIMCVLAYRTKGRENRTMFWISSMIAVLATVSFFMRFGHLFEYTPVFG